jgi:hypothetical protein
MNRLALLVTISLGTAPAAAESITTSHAADPAITMIASFGLELMGGADTFQTTGRSRLGLLGAIRTRGDVQPVVSLGATFAPGTLSAADPRALDGDVTLGYFDYGPELQLGLRFGRRGFVRDRVFASFSYLATHLDQRLALDQVGDVGGTRGFRTTVGGSWARSLGRAALSSRDGDRYDITSLLMLILPQQAELGWQRSAGSDRFGVTFSYGI